MTACGRMKGVHLQRLSNYGVRARGNGCYVRKGIALVPMPRMALGLAWLALELRRYLRSDLSMESEVTSSHRLGEITDPLIQPLEACNLHDATVR